MKNISSSISFIALFFAFSLATVRADNSYSQLVSVSFENCKPRPEICGSGFDEDCDGVDMPCPGNDKDRDGFSDHQDCDDENKFIYPGVFVGCEGGCGVGTKLCGANGQYSACSCVPLCEAEGAGKCYYINPLTGNDSNSGSFSQPLKTLLRLTSYSNGTPPPDNKIVIKAGDVIYLMSGLYSDSYMSDGTRNIFKFKSVFGTADARVVLKAYPGQSPPVFYPKDDNTQAITVLDTKWIKIEGIIVDHSLLEGIWVADSDNVEIANVTVRNTHGEDNHNLSGVKFTLSTNVFLHHSILLDNYDRINADTDGIKTSNSRNIVLFGGGNAKITHNYIAHSPEYTSDKAGACLYYKHAMTLQNGFFEVGHNVFQNCYDYAAGSVSSNIRFHNNVILDSEFAFSIRPEDIALTPPPSIIENNTVVRSRALRYDPDTALYIDGGAFAPVVLRNNLLVDNNAHDADQGGYVAISVYGSDVVHDKIISGSYLRFQNNCYYNDRESGKFCLFCGSMPEAQKGGLYTFGQWQDLGFDTSSVLVDPKLDNFFRATVPSCSGVGVAY